MKSNNALRALELHGNRVGADSAAALGGALKSNSALQALNQHMRARAVAARLYYVRRVPGHHRGDDRADAALRSITAQPALAEALGATRGRFRRQLADRNTGTMEQRARAVRVVRRHNALELPLAQLPGPVDDAAVAHTHTLDTMTQAPLLLYLYWRSRRPGRCRSRCELGGVHVRAPSGLGLGGRAPLGGAPPTQRPPEARLSESRLSVNGATPIHWLRAAIGGPVH